jgi:hypothetical protein
VRLDVGRVEKVGRFVADITRAKRIFKLKSPDDPVFGMD